MHCVRDSTLPLWSSSNAPLSHSWAWPSKANSSLHTLPSVHPLGCCPEPLWPLSVHWLSYGLYANFVSIIFLSFSADLEPPATYSLQNCAFLPSCALPRMLRKAILHSEGTAQACHTGCSECVCWMTDWLLSAALAPSFSLCVTGDIHSALIPGIQLAPQICFLCIPGIPTEPKPQIPLVWERNSDLYLPTRWRSLNRASHYPISCQILPCSRTPRGKRDSVPPVFLTFILDFSPPANILPTFLSFLQFLNWSWTSGTILIWSLRSGLFLVSDCWFLAPSCGHQLEFFPFH